MITKEMLTNYDYSLYKNQIQLKQFGLYGQQSLFHKKFACIGLGGLGTPLTTHLASSGIIHLGIIDFDFVEKSNLHRQYLFSYNDIGEKKINVVKNNLLKINNRMKIESYFEKINPENINSILSDYEIIIDCTDNFQTNFLLNDYCVRNNKILVYGSVSGFTASISLIYSEWGGCLRCIYPSMPSHYKANCQELGVFSGFCGVVAAIQANQAIFSALGKKHCTDNRIELLTNKLLKIDFTDHSFISYQYEKLKNCKVCSTNEEINYDYFYKNDNYCQNNSNYFEIKREDISSLDDYLLLDVRDESEYKINNIKNSINVPLYKLSNNPYFNEITKSKNIIIYCQGDLRSKKAAKIIESMGFNNIYRVINGLSSFDED